MKNSFLARLRTALGGDSVPAKLARETIEFHPSSYADPHGRVFTAEGRLYRAIPAESAAVVSQLFDSGVVDILVARQLIVPTRRTALQVEGFALVLEHDRVPFVSYPYEWSAEMLRAAAVHTLRLLEELARHGLTLRDAHGWNLVFEGCRPVFIDFGSIIAATPGGPWRAEQEFQEYFLHPLAMMGAGHDRLARALLRDYEQGISLQNCATIVGLGVPQRPPEAPAFAWYRELISGYVFPSAGTTWSAYYNDSFPALTPEPAWSGKHRAVHALLQQFRPATVLDVGSNRGWYALLAAASGARVVAFDNDPICIDQLYREAAARGVDVQPLVMSFVSPSPGYGLGRGVMASAADRLPCELVLALAVVHHLVFKMHLNFERIAEGLAVYARQTLIVEFPPAEDVHVSNWMLDQYHWYTQENFVAELRRHFSKVSVVPSDPAPRVLLVCER